MRRYAFIFCIAGLFGATGQATLAQAKADPSPLTRAREHVDRGQPHKAIALLESVPADRRGFDVNVLLGQSYQRVQRLADARRAYRAAIGQQPNTALPYVLLGRVYDAEGKLSLAGQAYESAERLGADSAELHARLARVFYRRGNCLGRVQTRALPNTSPGSIRDGVYVVEPVPNAEGLYFVAPRASAIYHLQKALDAGLSNVNLQLLHADIWLCARRHQRALAIYQTIDVNALPPYDRPQYHQHFAEACLGIDDVESYLAHLKLAVALAPEAYPDALDRAYRTLADRAAADGDLPKYLEYLQHALGQDPNDADLHYRLGNAHFEAGHNSDAARHWLIALELQPDHPDRNGMLDRLGRLSGASQASRKPG